MRIDQLLAGYADGDAISHMAVCLRTVFREWGCDSDIYADMNCVSPGLQDDCRPLEDYAGADSDICLHHYGIDSPAAQVFKSARAVKIFIYHNITPPEFFQGYDDELARQLTLARIALPEVARMAAACWTVSRFNAAELAAIGLEGVRVLPLVFDPRALDIASDPFIVRQCAGGLTNIMFVGRVAPNKRVEDLIEAFAWYHKALNPFSRLWIVGSNRSAPRYYTMLRMLAGDLDLPNVCFAGFAAPAGLTAYYRAADLYVCPSAHEGYCLPLLEAMHAGAPVVARRAGGMPEALDGAGIMYEDLTPQELAQLMHRAVGDPVLRQTVLQAQRARLQREYSRPLPDELRDLLKPYLTGCP